MQAASQLFYDRGITSTGVEAVVRSAGVTKPTLYTHFSGKVDLVTAVLQRRHEDRAAELGNRLARLDPLERPLGVFDWLQEWYARHGERGCGFLNAAAELRDPDDPARIVVQQEKAWLLNLLAQVCEEARLSDAPTLASQLLLLIDGVAGRVLVGGPSVAEAATADARFAAATLLNAASR